MNKAELIRAIMIEMDRVWGHVGLGGTEAEYAWLQFNYDIGEWEDVRWSVIALGDHHDFLDDDEDDDLRAFLADDRQVEDFLVLMLGKYRNGEVIYLR
jgi:hypothetical protein